MTEYWPRSIAGQIVKALETMPVVVITGMRQTGKSTFLLKQEELKDRYYISFDDFENFEAAKMDPAGFIQSLCRKHEKITIDEAQKIPEILTAIKIILDRERVPGQFLLSGSANFSLIKGIKESLAGRAIYYTMYPLTRREINRSTNKSFLKSLLETGEPAEINVFEPVQYDDVLKGGMPSVCLDTTINRDLWFKGYEQTYLERDIIGFSQIANIISFRNLMHLAGLRTGKIINISDLARDAKINAVTASRYLSLLEASFIVYLLNPYLNNRSSRLIKSPKLYFTDSGIASFLNKSDYLEGSLFETYIAQNIMGIISSDMPYATVGFWNIQGRHEVDFIIESDRRCVAIEVKMTTKLNYRDISSIKTFLETTPGCIAGLFAYNGEKSIRLADKIWAVPSGVLIS